MRILERARRIERPTLTLARLCSTPELRPRSKLGVGYRPARPLFQAVLLFAFEHWLALGDERSEGFLVIGASAEHREFLGADLRGFIGRKTRRQRGGSLGRFHRERRPRGDASGECE